MNGRERFLAACRRQPVDATPVWFMRQAGRYLPEYRELRKTHPILELAKTPHLAFEVAMQPLRRFDLDAAILFADIVLPLEPMGLDVDLPDNVGPVVARPVRTARDVEALQPVDVARELDFVLETVRMLREHLGGETALLGFAAAPFTLASYMIEGRPTREFVHTKRLMHAHPGAWEALMDRLVDVLTAYLAAQVRAGVDAVQLFDSWAGHLTPHDYVRFAAPHSRRVLDGLAGLDVPRIHFATPTGGLLEPLGDAGADVVGVDWRTPLDVAWDRLGADVGVQGNLDPGVLAADGPAALDAATRILHQAGGRPGHVFNLGHGVLPPTPPEHVAALVDHVHAESRRLLAGASA